MQIIRNAKQKRESGEFNVMENIYTVQKDPGCTTKYIFTVCRHLWQPMSSNKICVRGSVTAARASTQGR